MRVDTCHFLLEECCPTVVNLCLEHSPDLIGTINRCVGECFYKWKKIVKR